MQYSVVDFVGKEYILYCFVMKCEEGERRRRDVGKFV